MKISVIVPCYNAGNKIIKCLDSIKRQNISADELEVIIADDCSSDNSKEIIKNYIKNLNNWHLIELPVNSGSPSKPRNEALGISKGQYLFYLDSDDELLDGTLSEYYRHAIDADADILRGYLLLNDGTKKIEANKIKNFSELNSKKEKIKGILSSQSTTVCQLIKRDILINNDIKWPENIRVGEDTIFLIEVLLKCENIEYIDHPTFIYNKIEENGGSTHSYGDRELNNHLNVWRYAINNLKKIDIDYSLIRLKIGIQTALTSFVKYYSKDLSESTFTKFKQFIIEHKATIENFKFNSRLTELIQIVINRGLDDFLDAIKPRLLITGYDLKFIKSALPHLKAIYNIKVDEWSGHNSHNVQQSTELLKWAEIIFCEWCLGNVKWYSEHKNAEQKLYVRCHRFELNTPWTINVDHTKIDRFICVSVYFYEKLIERIGCPRGKVTVIPNYLITDEYISNASESKLFNIGVIGILPSRKGFLNALRIIHRLVDEDSRYKLHIYGQSPKDVSWIAKDPSEMEYYKCCNDYINDNNLKDNIIEHGWVDIKTAISEVGFVLSVSKNEEICESFHIAPSDGFAAGGCGLILRWNGVEYIYPSKYIFENEDDLLNKILETNTLEKLQKYSEDGINFIKSRYNEKIFTSNFARVVK